MAKKPRELFDYTALWESGTALDAAWLRHSPTVEPFDLVALRTHPDQDEALRRNPRYAMLGDWLPSTYESRQIKLKNTIESLRHYLLTMLYEGNLWAIGCRSREEGSDEKVIVPPEYFFYPLEEEKAFKRISWQEGALSAEGTLYFDIRVVVPLPLSDVQAPPETVNSTEEAEAASSGSGDSIAEPKFSIG